MDTDNATYHALFLPDKSINNLDELTQHGGNLREAALKYDIPLENWLDLSTGMNPKSWEIPSIPETVWQRLPEETDDLISAAKNYYGDHPILPLAGSQAAIQTLPSCFKESRRINIVEPSYAEHYYCWYKAGQQVIQFDVETTEMGLRGVHGVVLVNPNNPDGRVVPLKRLYYWAERLQQDQSILIVDEAFMDTTPEHSLLNQPLPENVIVLRSFGKFFGLAGIRLGFMMANPQILEAIKIKQATWGISHVTRWIGIRALQDTQWQHNTTQYLKQQSKILRKTLQHSGLTISGQTDFFCYVKLQNPKKLQQQLAQQGIWIRCFPHWNSVRFGLIANKKQCLRLQQALQKCTYSAIRS